MRFLGLLLFVACLIGVVPVASSVARLAAPGPIWLHTTYKAGFAPQKILVDIHIEPVESDRTVWLFVYESGIESTTSEIPLTEGAQSRRTHHFVFEAKWPGVYTIVAQIGHGSTARAWASA